MEIPAKTRREFVVAFRLTPSEVAHVDAAASALKTPRGRSDYCRAAALHIARQRVPPPAKPVALPPRRKATYDIQRLTQILQQVGQISSRLAETATPPTQEVVTAVLHQTIEIRNAIASVLGGGKPSKVTK
jgi:hypothetical protein